MKLKFNGHWLEFFGMQLLMSVITFITVGLFGIIQFFWTVKFFIEGIEIVQNDVETKVQK